MEVGQLIQLYSGVVPVNCYDAEKNGVNEAAVFACKGSTSTEFNIGDFPGKCVLGAPSVSQAFEKEKRFVPLAYIKSNRM